MEGINLQDSFVLDWSLGDNQLTFEIEASVWPDSQHYSAPKASEYTCYKKARLRFVNFNSLVGLKDKKTVNGSSDANGEIDYGNIDSFEVTETGFLVIGDFGAVNITGGEVVFEIHT